MGQATSQRVVRRSTCMRPTQRVAQLQRLGPTAGKPARRAGSGLSAQLRAGEVPVC
jgi:hypothetical protein